MREYRDDQGDPRAPGPRASALLVCVGPGRAGRAAGARRQAHGDRAACATGSWSTSRRRSCCACPKPSATGASTLLRLAESLGAEAVTLAGAAARRGHCSTTRARATSPASWSAGRSRRGWRTLAAALDLPANCVADAERHRRATSSAARTSTAARAARCSRAASAYLGRAPGTSGKTRWPGYAWAVGCQRCLHRARLAS